MKRNIGKDLFVFSILMCVVSSTTNGMMGDIANAIAFGFTGVIMTMLLFYFHS